MQVYGLLLQSIAFILQTARWVVGHRGRPAVDGPNSVDVHGRSLIGRSLLMISNLQVDRLQLLEPRLHGIHQRTAELPGRLHNVLVVVKNITGTFVVN